MTEQHTEPEAVEAEEKAEDTAGRPEREAAKYRRQLREVEQARDTLAAQVEAMRKSEAERLAAASITRPGALWAAGANVADLLTDEGTVDPEKVTAAAHAARETLGLAAPLTGPIVADVGDAPEAQRPTFDEAFAPPTI